MATKKKKPTEPHKPPQHHPKPHHEPEPRHEDRIDRRQDAKIGKIEEQLHRDEREIQHLEHEVRELEHPHKPLPTKGDFHYRQGSTNMADGTILKGQSQIDAVATESNGDGPVATVPANMAWSVDDPSIVSPAINPDGSATFTKVGISAVDRVANVTWNDTFFGLSASHTVTVQGDGGTTNPPTAGDFNFQNAR